MKGVSNYITIYFSTRLSIDTAMLTFRVGQEIQAYPVSNNQAFLEINESLGLGIDWFLAGKKIAMLNGPAAYLQNRNEKLAALPADIKKDYDDDALLKIQGLATGYENSLWVKQLTSEDALLKAKARKRQMPVSHISKCL